MAKPAAAAASLAGPGKPPKKSARSSKNDSKRKAGFVNRQVGFKIRKIHDTIMKWVYNIAGGLLGVAFVMSGVVVLFNLAPMPPPPPEGTPPAHFFAAFGPTGYLTFVKVFEVIGGVLVAIPKVRALGLLVLGPIIVNILAFHAFV